MEKDPSLRSIAYHEAGHAVVAFLLGRWILRITIVPGYEENDEWRGFYNGLEASTDGHSYEEALIAIAGPIAQKQFGDPRPWRETTDYTQVENALKEFKTDGFEKVNQYAEKLVELMVDQHWELITALAERLLMVKEMDGDDAKEFLIEAHQKCIREAQYPPDPIFDGLDEYEAWIEKHKEKLDAHKEFNERPRKEGPNEWDFEEG